MVIGAVSAYSNDSDYHTNSGVSTEFISEWRQNIIHIFQQIKGIIPIKELTKQIDWGCNAWIQTDFNVLSSRNGFLTENNDLQISDDEKDNSIRNENRHEQDLMATDTVVIENATNIIRIRVYYQKSKYINGIRV